MEVSKEQYKEAKKELMEEAGIENVNVKENTATPILPTTPYYIKSWGYIDINKKVLVEQLTPEVFYYDINGIKGTVNVGLGGGFEINGNRFFFKQKKVYDGRLFYNIPDVDLVKKYLEGDYKPRAYADINKDIINHLNVLFDFKGNVDVQTSSLCIGQSWIKPRLNEFFFYGVDSSYGGGKTTLGEIVYFSMRHGFVGGNISSASIPRLTDELDLNIFIDEIDQNSKDDDCMAILRKGQRRGNPYVRCEGRDNRPVAYDLAGIHGFSFRSELEDAFMNRALRIHSVKSNDYMLPVINSAKKDILKPLADELFIWYLDNIFKFDSNIVATCSEEKGILPHFSDMTLSRKKIYDSLTAHLNIQEKEFLTKVFGRDSELTFLCLHVSKILGLDILENLKTIMTNRGHDELSSESYYLEALKEFIYQYSKNIFAKYLRDGVHAGCCYYPKSKLYQNFIKYLKELNVNTIGTKKFTSMLRDLGFVEGDTITSQRYDTYPTPCLIFNKEICEKIGLKFNKNFSFEKDSKETKFKPLERFEVVTFQRGRGIPLTFEIDKTYPQSILGDLSKEMIEILVSDNKIKLEVENGN